MQISTSEYSDILQNLVVCFSHYIRHRLPKYIVGDEGIWTLGSTNVIISNNYDHNRFTKDIFLPAHRSIGYRQEINMTGSFPAALILLAPISTESLYDKINDIKSKVLEDSDQPEHAPTVESSLLFHEEGQSP